MNLIKYSARKTKETRNKNYMKLKGIIEYILRVTLFLLFIAQLQDKILNLYLSLNSLVMDCLHKILPIANTNE